MAKDTEDNDDEEDDDGTEELRDGQKAVYCNQHRQKVHTTPARSFKSHF